MRTKGVPESARAHGAERNAADEMDVLDVQAVAAGKDFAERFHLRGGSDSPLQQARIPMLLT